jgi:hypothetical protein
MRPATILLALILPVIASSCWYYSRPEGGNTGCEKTSYGFLTASSQSESCPQASPAPSPVPPGAPEAPGITPAPPVAEPAPQ